jgi:alkaline phosphatase D
MDRRHFIQGAGSLPLLAAAGRVCAETAAADAYSASQLLFAHGVASGDPLADAVMLWTRVSVARGHDDVPVRWLLATDEQLQQVVTTGETRAEHAHDFCVKVDAGGLQPGQTYYYAFEAMGQRSMIGRTRTLPVGAVSHLAFAVASCSNYPAGFFNAYRDIALNDDLQAVIHLGDYIYEQARDGYATARSAEFGRELLPKTELLTLDDYRLRHAQYKTDEDLQLMHASHPMIAVWDDHEVANDAWMGGAQNHQDDEGDWQQRRRAAWRAYMEWMPVRNEDDLDQIKLYRQFQFGDLATLIMLDTRYIGRDQQIDAMGYSEQPEALRAALADPQRSLLGSAQENWFEQTLQQAQQTRWQLIGQQVMLAPLLIPDLSAVLDQQRARKTLGNEIVDALLNNGGGQMPLLLDTWDGYPAARGKFLQALQQHALSPVVLTGDIHTSIAADVYLQADAAPVAVELITTAISSPGFDNYMPTHEPGQLAQQFLAHNAHLRWFETGHRGWLRVQLSADECRAQWRLIDRIDTRDYKVSVGRELRTAHKSSQDFGLRQV